MPGPSRLGQHLLIALATLLLLAALAAADNKQYHMSSLCKNHFLQLLYRKTEGAVLKSRNERNLDCVITFQTHAILQRFMLRFEELQLDCNDHLYIYDGAHAVGAFKADLSCRNTKQAVGAIFTRTNFVTLKYVTDAWGTESNGFNLVITAVKDPKLGCAEFRCKVRQFCIATDLVCDGVNHCADGSDEAISSNCARSEGGGVLGMSRAMLVVGLVSGALLLCACAVTASVCLCRNHPRPPPPNHTLGEMSGANGAGTVVKVQGNWYHPAGLGYTSRPPLYCPGKSSQPRLTATSRQARKMSGLCRGG